MGRKATPPCLPRLTKLAASSAFAGNSIRHSPEALAPAEVAAHSDSTP
jgi:hypothetical protein